jgi:hypothetical protein
MGKKSLAGAESGVTPQEDETLKVQSLVQFCVMGKTQYCLCPKAENRKRRTDKGGPIKYYSRMLDS